MSVPVIRTAVPEDAHAILELWRLAGAFPTRSDNEESVCSLVAHDQEAVLVAEEDGELAGTLVAAFDGWRGTLFRLAVLPSHRRRGVARALVAAGERSLRDRGAVRVSLYAIRAETEALEFWSAIGYERDERVVRFVKNLEP
ncbi:MAG: GNAT family N-acetyltransferase [Gaiellaceae bacterium]